MGCIGKLGVGLDMLNGFGNRPVCKIWEDEDHHVLIYSTILDNNLCISKKNNT